MKRVYDYPVGLNAFKVIYSFFLRLNSLNAEYKWLLPDVAITNRGYFWGYERFYGPTPSFPYL